MEKKHFIHRLLKNTLPTENNLWNQSSSGIIRKGNHFLLVIIGGHSFNFLFSTTYKIKLFPDSPSFFVLQRDG